ncbi:unnamed protein product [Paramecium sonneborni]|uniref:Insulin-like growth factor binding protein, N-terminal n=1 Tax=Paramecium sonneborni TaxID=65129 RepID=A0A8S1RMX3_9CILI|nr:unnamed protein product [Paramecium sonneborni]
MINNNSQLNFYLLIIIVNQNVQNVIIHNVLNVCHVGIYLIFNDCNTQSTNINQVICGDGIIQDFEQCDDANTIPFDGCFECQYQCDENCIDCIDGICLQQELIILDCDYGFHLIDQNCLSICGDLIIASDEKCDDDNNEPFDGCFQCQYSCSLYCKNCIEGQCMICDIGYLLQNNRCQEYCGDGIKSFNEQCDDGNQFSLDGCSEECQIENLWKCNTDEQEMSICFQSDNPIVELQYLNITFNKKL